MARRMKPFIEMRGRIKKAFGVLSLWCKLYYQKFPFASYSYRLWNFLGRIDGWLFHLVSAIIMERGLCSNLYFFFQHFFILKISQANLIMSVDRNYFLLISALKFFVIQHKSWLSSFWLVYIQWQRMREKDCQCQWVSKEKLAEWMNEGREVSLKILTRISVIDCVRWLVYWLLFLVRNH